MYQRDAGALVYGRNLVSVMHVASAIESLIRPCGLLGCEILKDRRYYLAILATSDHPQCEKTSIENWGPPECLLLCCLRPRDR